MNQIAVKVHRDAGIISPSLLTTRKSSITAMYLVDVHSHCPNRVLTYNLMSIELSPGFCRSHLRWGFCQWVELQPRFLPSSSISLDSLPQSRSSFESLRQAPKFHHTGKWSPNGLHQIPATTSMQSFRQSATRSVFSPPCHPQGLCLFEGGNGNGFAICCRIC
jgi:hypothetical protein